MFGRLRRAPVPEVPGSPELHLSGPRLRRAFEHLAEAAESTGGVERYVTALALKASLFDELLGKGRADELTEAEFLDLAAFITPARRRVAAWLQENGYDVLRLRLGRLLDGEGGDASVADRMAVFCASFPKDKAHRWVRDLAAELLHFTAPERIPLMTRWVWDARVGTGVLRELWFTDDVSTVKITVPDTLAVFRQLSEEMAGFLAGEGVYRDLPYYTDLLLAHVYAAYINDRGGEMMRAEFVTASDPMLHTRRMLGLDAVDTETGRTRLKLIDGRAHVLGTPQAITHQEAP